MQQIDAQMTFAINYDAGAFKDSLDNAAKAATQNLERALEGEINDGLLLAGLDDAEVEDVAYGIDIDIDTDTHQIRLELVLDVSYDFVVLPNRVETAMKNVFNRMIEKEALSPDSSLLVRSCAIEAFNISGEPSSSLSAVQLQKRPEHTLTPSELKAKYDQIADKAGGVDILTALKRR